MAKKNNILKTLFLIGLAGLFFCVSCNPGVSNEMNNSWENSPSQVSNTPSSNSLPLDTQTPSIPAASVTKTSSSTLRGASNDRHLTVMEIDCIGTFEEFAFYPETVDPSIFLLEGFTFPVDLEEIAMPTPEGERKQRSNYYNWLQTTRLVDGEVEILIERQFTDRGIPNELLIYNATTRGWKVFSADIGETTVAISMLWTTSDGAIWAMNSNRYYDHSIWDRVPFFSKFDEETETFDLVENSIFRVSTDETYHYDLVMLDRNDVFWVFVQYDGLYSFNTQSGEVIKHASFPDYIIGDAAILSNGTIYFTQESYTTNQIIVSLFRFIPDAGDMEEIKLPDERLDEFFYIFVDRNDNLWLGATGWIEPDGSWHLLSMTSESHPILRIDFESIDGKLWFSREMTWNTSGTAWYQPGTGEGCWLTDFYGRIVEDDSGVYWFELNHSLYSFDLRQ